jgi:catechol 2,3-dioxygenase-like lactoylglutathione lyase family enzyme
MVMLRAGNAMIELFQYETPPPKQGDPNRPVCDHGITHLCLDVTDLDAEYARLKAAGMTFHCPPQNLGPAVRTTYGRDPDGNVIELQEIGVPDSPLALDIK